MYSVVYQLCKIFIDIGVSCVYNDVEKNVETGVE